jgi:hypothetical protein
MSLRRESQAENSSLYTQDFRSNAQTRSHCSASVDRLSCVNEGVVVLEHSIVARKERLDYRMHLITQTVHILPCHEG